ncbi:MAG: AraC family transcriptional regulator [Rhizobiales bacterium]|nr:AraC family transcriptional regulator [Hyphomicrobiales bacterium]
MSNAVAVYHGRFGRATLYNLDHDLATHAHREGHLTFYVQGRPCSMTVQDEYFPLDPHTAVAVNPWEPHAFHAGDAENGSLFLVLYIKPIWFLETARNAQSWLRFGRSEIEITSQIQRSVSMVVSLLLEGEETGLFDGYLYELTRECFDQSWQWTPDGAPRVDCASPFTDFRVRKSMRLMSEKLGETFELDEVARESGLSRPHFYKLFRKQTGLTPNLFLNTLRMERAIESLTSTEKSVTNIGFDLGFSSQASFTRFFTSNVGIAPSDYRRVAHLALS